MSDEEENNTAFGVGPGWVEGEYYEKEGKKGRKSKQRRREEAMLGVFGSDDEEEEEEEARRRKDTAPSFVRSEVSAPSTPAPPRPGPHPAARPHPTPTPSKPQGEMGAWEKHTKGIGSKLLAKMGWQGGGLGAEGRGRATPVQVSLRPKGEGIGFSDLDAHTPEPPPTPSPAGPVELDRAEGWRRERPRKRARVAYEETSPPPPPALKVLVWGAGGAQEATSLSSALTPVRTPRLLPELAYNLGLLVAVRQGQVREHEAAREGALQERGRLVRQRGALSRALSLHAGGREGLEDLRAVLRRCAQLGPLEQLEALRALKMERGQEWRQHHVAEGGVLGLVLPAALRDLKGWAPLYEPDRPLPLLRALNSLFGEETKEEEEEEEEEEGSRARLEADLIRTRFGHDLLFPTLRLALAQWRPRADPSSALGLVASLLPHLAAPLQAALLDTLLLPRIRLEVEQWQPREDPTPIGRWLLPWAPLLADRLNDLWGLVRQKLGSVLTAWTPSDPSARHLLAPLQVAWGAQWAPFLSRHITPKLLSALAQGDGMRPPLNPGGAWVEALQWAPLLELAPLRALLRAATAQLLLALHQWLSGPAPPPFDLVTKWYLAAKGALPPSLAQEGGFLAAFTRALELMQAALAGRLPPHPPSVDDLFLPVAPPQPPSSSTSAPLAPPRPMLSGPSFREVVSSWAEAHGLFLKPSHPPRSHEGRPIFHLGRAQLVLLREGLLVLREGRWLPTSLERLLPLALDSV